MERGSSQLCRVLRPVMLILLLSFYTVNIKAYEADDVAAEVSTFKPPQQQLPVVQVPQQCQSACSALANGLVYAECITCLNSNGAVNSYVVSMNQPRLGNLTCDGGNPAEYAWACMRELTASGRKSSTASGSAAAATAAPADGFSADIAAAATVTDVVASSTAGAAAAAAAAASSPSTWGMTFKAPRIQRLPLYELGYTNIPAMPVLYPARFLPATAMLYKETRNMALYQNGINFQNGAKNVRIARFEQALDAGSDIDIATTCVKKQGWLSPRGAASPACEGSPATNRQLANVTLDTPERLAMMFPTNRQRATWQPTAQAESRAFLTDAAAAADSLWTISQNIFTSSQFYQNISSPADLQRVKAMYAGTWNSSWDAAAAAGKLVQLNLTFLEGWNPAGDANAGPGTWNIQTHALLLYQGTPEAGNVKLTVQAVRLSNAGGSKAAAVYTPQRSESAFILAVACVRSAFTQALIWYGHVFAYHAISGGIVYALYNTIQPDTPSGLASHPMRQLLDHYLDPTFNVQFLDNLFLPGGYIPPTPIVVEHLPRLFELYCKQGPISPVSLYSITPAGMMAWSGLNPKAFTKPQGQPWDQYPMAKIHLQMAEMTGQLAADSLGPFYPTDRAVARDAGVQAWAAAMVNPKGGNLRKITAAGNAVTTRAALYELVGNVLYATLAHGTAHLQDYFIRMLSLSHHPIVMSISSLPDPTKTYTLAELLAALPNSDLYGRYMGFCFSFIGAPGFTQLVPGSLNQETGEAVPNFEADLPFPRRRSRRDDAANAAVVRFRRAVAAFLADEKHSSAIKLMNTNWGAPLAMPRVINL